jgi:hypothetical protein
LVSAKVGAGAVALAVAGAAGAPLVIGAVNQPAQKPGTTTTRLHLAVPGKSGVLQPWPSRPSGARIVRGRGTTAPLQAHSVGSPSGFAGRPTARPAPPPPVPSTAPASHAAAAGAVLSPWGP